MQKAKVRKLKRKLFVFLLITTLSMFVITTTSCKKKPKKIKVSPETSLQGVAQSTPNLGLVENQETNQATPEIEIPELPEQEQAEIVKVSVEVTKTKAYFFGGENPALYGAIEFKNTSNEFIVVSEATFVFNIGEQKAELSFVPMLNNDDVVAPGATSSICGWLPFEKVVDQKIEPTLKASIGAQKSDSQRRTKSLKISNETLVQNYPNFATISGTATNSSKQDNYSLMLIYFSFYDEKDDLIGTWHFIQNVAIPSGESRNFVNHLNQLPVPQLAQKTSRIVVRGIGID